MNHLSNPGAKRKLQEVGKRTRSVINVKSNCKIAIKIGNMANEEVGCNLIFCKICLILKKNKQIKHFNKIFFELHKLTANGKNNIFKFIKKIIDYSTEYNMLFVACVFVCFIHLFLSMVYES